MDTLHGSRTTAAKWFAVSEVDYHRQRVTTMYQRSWLAQQKTKTTGAFSLLFADFVKCVEAPFGVHTETQSASDIGLWHRDRMHDIRKLPLIGGIHRYATGESRKILFVLFESKRLRVLTD